MLTDVLTAKQIEFCRNMNHRWCFRGGATRSGKTYLDYRWTIPMRIRERVGKDGLAVILGVTKSTIERNVLEPMRGIYGDDMVSYIGSDNTARLFGERCYCLGAEKLSQVSKLRGSSIKYCYGDEVADWSEDVFNLLKSRLDKSYSCFDGTYNPQGPNHWLHTFLQSDADIFSQTYGIDDNPFLPPEFVTNLKAEYAGTVLYDRYILGLWAAAEGALFTTYPKYTDDVTFFRDGIAHIDAAYGGEDYTAFTCAKRQGDTLYLYGKMWKRHVDTVIDTCIADAKRLLCAPILTETNADKGYLAKEIQRRGYTPRTYHEDMNKHLKISTFLKKWWPNVVFLTGTDKGYIGQIMSYTEDAPHDDACLDGDTMVATLFGNKRICDVKTGEYVITPAGPRKVLFSGITGYDKEVRCYNGVWATPDHKFFNPENGEFSPADSLTCGTSCDTIGLKEMIRWRVRLLSSMEKPISEAQRANITSSIQQEMKREKEHVSCIGQYGNTTTARFLLAIKFIMLTVTSTITTFPIWSAYQLGSIFRGTRRRTAKNRSFERSNLKASRKLAKHQKSGMQAKKGENGTESTPLNQLGRSERTELTSNANIAERHLRQCRGLYTVRRVAKKKQGVDGLASFTSQKKSLASIAENCSFQRTNAQDSVRKNAKISDIGKTRKTNVYNLTVENAGCFYANGILVSNCDSAACCARWYDKRGGEQYQSLLGL